MSSLISKILTTVLPLIVQKAFTSENATAGSTKAAVALGGAGGIVLANRSLEIVPINSEYELVLATVGLVAGAILFFVRSWVSEHTPELELEEENSK